MRHIACLLTVGLAACAGQPSTPAAPAPATVVATNPSTSSGSAQSDEDKKRAHARSLGYKLVKREGHEDVFCRTDRQLGSHISEATTCMTQAELDLYETQMKQQLNSPQLQAPHKPGN